MGEYPFKNPNRPPRWSEGMRRAETVPVGAKVMVYPTGRRTPRYEATVTEVGPERPEGEQTGNRPVILSVEPEQTFEVGGQKRDKVSIGGGTAVVVLSAPEKE